MQLRAPTLLILSLLSGTAIAQDSGNQPVISTQTPPELRDFRLDSPATPQGPEQRLPPPRERPPAQQQVPPATGPAPSQPSRETAPSVAPSNSARGSIAPAIARPATAIPAPASDTVDAAAPSLSADSPVETPSPLPEIAAPLPADSGTQPSEAETRWSISDLLVAGGAVLLAILIAGFFFWRRRPAAPPEYATRQISGGPQPSPPTRLPVRKYAPPNAAPPPAPLPAQTGSALHAAFTPEMVQLSIASLTLTGKLRVENRGTGSINELQLRSVMISAQDRQREAADAFHQAGASGDLQHLGTLAAGNRIDATLEFRIPRNELASFRWTDREFVAPILLINLKGQSQGGPVEVRLSQLVGREGAAPSPRLKPLPIDRGPKRYSAIGTRPVFG